MIRRLIFLPIAPPELAAGEKYAEHFPDIAIGSEMLGEPLDEGRRRIVWDKILRQLEGYVVGGRRAFCENASASSPSALPLDRSA